MNPRMLFDILPLFLIMTFSRKVLGLRCYSCENTMSAACGPDFKAYQFDAEPCPEVGGIDPICGKQVQPPGERGWVGVIRSCYIPGELPGLNASNGCQYYRMESSNFTALYCFCDTDNCNGAGRLTLDASITLPWIFLIVFPIMTSFTNAYCYS